MGAVPFRSDRASKPEGDRNAFVPAYSAPCWTTPFCTAQPILSNDIAVTKSGHDTRTMKTVSFDEARADFERVFKFAANGETVVVERHAQRVEPRPCYGTGNRPARIFPSR